MEPAPEAVRLALGWTDALQEAVQTAPEALRALQPARVAAVAANQWRVLGLSPPEGARSGPDDGRWAMLAGALRHGATDALDRPTVGDWVLVRWDRASDPPRIEAILPRHTLFVRRAKGSTGKPQPIAANVDTVLVVTTVGHDFNPNRLERYLAAVLEAGAEPVIVLNKTDQPFDPAALAVALDAVAPGVPVAWTSAVREDGAAELRPWLRPGRTLALVGSSGVGKSSLVNRLAADHDGAAAVRTGPIRLRDGKGRHTTTTRTLHALPGGVLVLDTPGMRELGLWQAEEGLDAAFQDVVALIARCRFRDCAHGDEPDCAVQAAIEDGSLDPERFERWLALSGESAVAYETGARGRGQRHARIQTRAQRAQRQLDSQLGIKER